MPRKLSTHFLPVAYDGPTGGQTGGCYIILPGTGRIITLSPEEAEHLLHHDMDESGYIRSASGQIFDPSNHHNAAICPYCQELKGGIQLGTR